MERDGLTFRRVTGPAHVVAEIRFPVKGDPTRFSVCQCGERFEGFRSNAAMADAFRVHAEAGNGRKAGRLRPATADEEVA